MSNDLISRKLVYADDIYRYIKTEINPCGKPFDGSAYEFGLKVMGYIENMSAAYDVDKVERQIESKMFSAEVYNDDMDGVQIDNLLCMGDVHEILREGGAIDNH